MVSLWDMALGRHLSMKTGTALRALELPGQAPYLLKR